jgi:hypothetical protein
MVVEDGWVGGELELEPPPPPPQAAIKKNRV